MPPAHDQTLTERSPPPAASSLHRPWSGMTAQLHDWQAGGSVVPTSDADGPSWLAFLGHAKDSLWSVDLFRCESLILKTHWVMVVMDQFTRRIIGFAVQPGVVDGPALCRMFNQVIAGAPGLPEHLSSDHDPLFQFHRWKANLRILEVSEIKTVPYVPLSHPFIERVIGTVRRELRERGPFPAVQVFVDCRLTRDQSTFKGRQGSHQMF